MTSHYQPLKFFQVRLKVEVRQAYPNAELLAWKEKELIVSVWAHTEDDAVELVEDKLKVDLE